MGLRYDALISAPAAGVPIATLLAGHDHDRWSRIDTRWAGAPVVEWSDADHPRTAKGARAGWILGSDDIDRRVRFVVLRDFDSPPTGPDASALALTLVGVGPAEACATEGPLGEIVVLAEARGTAWILADAAGTWALDRVEFFPKALGAEAFLGARVPERCIPRFRIDAEGALRQAREDG